MKKSKFISKDRYFHTIIINGYVTYLSVGLDEGHDIYKKFLKKEGVMGEEYLQFLVTSISTILEDKEKTIVCMEFKNIFKNYKKNKEIMVTLIYGER